ncbi:MAG TPA: CHRD domain-containing protein [Vicinamibacterales bacterium]|nr:CHRD domain-containing protein [Vicinamibacterales bacterium]
MRRWIAGLLMAGLVGLAPTLVAQTARTFKTRLAPVPVAAFNANIVGAGSVTATLTGTKLAVTGTFDGLSSPATQARIFKSPKPGMRGEPLLDLTVSGGTSGTIAGQFDLTAAQVQELSASRYYVQLHSEKAAEGNLWGWLMPSQEKGR